MLSNYVNWTYQTHFTSTSFPSYHFPVSTLCFPFFFPFVLRNDPLWPFPLSHAPFPSNLPFLSLKLPFPLCLDVICHRIHKSKGYFEHCDLKLDLRRPLYKSRPTVATTTAQKLLNRLLQVSGALFFIWKFCSKGILWVSFLNETSMLSQWLVFNFF